MINIYKFENDMWVLVEQCDEVNLLDRLTILRTDGNTYRAEIPTISGSEIVEV